MLIASLLLERTGMRETTFRVRLGKKQVEPEDDVELNASDSADGLSLTVSFCGRGGMPPYSAGDRVAVLHHGSVTLGSV